MSENNVILNYQKMIERIFGSVNAKREEITSLEESLTMSLSSIHGAKQNSDFIVAISWLISLANKYNIDLTEALLRKHPNVCYYCLKSPCICSITKKEPPKKMSEREKAKEREYFYSLLDKPYVFNFKYFVDSINKIYPANRSDFNHHGNYYHISKIFEELGELIQAINKFKQDDSVTINLEFADLFYWLLSLWSASFPDVDYDIAFEDYYLNGCRKCKSEVCKCINITVLRDYVDDDQLIAYKDAISKQRFADDISISNDLVGDLLFAIKSKNNEIRKDILQKTKKFCHEHGVAVDDRRSYRL